MEKGLKLKLRIIERYRTQSRFAVACGKKENWISRIITGRQEPTEKEKEHICAKLKIENADDYFGHSQKVS